MRFLKLITADVVFAALLFGASAVIAGIVKMQNPDLIGTILKRKDFNSTLIT